MQVTREILIRAGDDHIFIFIFGLCPRRIGRIGRIVQIQHDRAVIIQHQCRVGLWLYRDARLPVIRSAHGLTRGIARFRLDFQFIVLCEHETARDRVDKVLERRAVVKIHTMNRRRTAYVVYGQVVWHDLVRPRFNFDGIFRGSFPIFGQFFELNLNFPVSVSFVFRSSNRNRLSCRNT